MPANWEGQAHPLGWLERLRAAHHAAVQNAPFPTHFVIGNGAMQQTAVVPHDEITRLPAVSVDELPLGRVAEKLPEDCRTLRLGQAEDVRGMIAEIERPLAGVGMGAHERMIDRRI